MINELVGIIGLLVTVLVLVIKATVEITKMKTQLFPNGGSLYRCIWGKSEEFELTF